MRSKISVIGAGNVGATVAQFIALKDLGDVYLFDVVDGVPEGKALDMMEGTPHWGTDLNIKGFTTVDPKNYENMKGSDVIVITAGLARKPGMSRDDLLAKNIAIIADVAKGRPGTGKTTFSLELASRLYENQPIHFLPSEMVLLTREFLIRFTAMSVLSDISIR